MDSFDRDALIQKILKKDVEFSKKYAFKAERLFKISKYKSRIQFLEWSCNGLVWLTGLIALSYLINSRKWIEIEVNLILWLIIDIFNVAFLKAFTQRPRPTADDDFLNIGPNIFSFPSGYASRATFLFMFFTFLSPISKIFWLPLYAWWFALCITRVMLRKHHILDVLGGIVVGLIEGLMLWLFWMDQETALSIYNWISEERTVGSDAEIL